MEEVLHCIVESKQSLTNISMIFLESKIVKIKGFLPCLALYKQRLTYFLAFSRRHYSFIVF